MKNHERDTAIEVIQRCYPQIYLACHVKHIRATSTAHRLSARDSSLLVHLSPTDPTTPGALAAHMGVGASSLSAVITRLAKLGYLHREQSPRDRRTAELRLTAQGAKAMSATSVLDPNRLAAVVHQLTASERLRVLEGVELLAGACRQLALGLRKVKTHRRNRRYS